MKTGTNTLVLGALFSALSFVFLFLAGIVPGVEMTLYAIASAFPALMILEAGRAAIRSGREPSAIPGILVYIVTALLGFFLMPNKLAVIPYALFFGIYGILKYYIEKFNNAGVRNGLKIVVFGGLFSVAYLFFRDLCFSSITLPDMAFPVLLILAVAVLMLYDYIFSLGISYYIRRIHGGRL